MNKASRTAAGVLVAAFTLSVIAGTPSSRLFGVDVVSAASEQTKPTTPAKPAKPTTTKASAGKTTTTTAIKVARLLAFHSYGDDVKLVQTLLNNNGYKLRVDGIFGEKTLAAVKSYQSKHGLKVDGIVGPKTMGKLNPAPVVATAPVVQKTTIKVGRVEYAAHGTKCFTVAVAAVAGDKIVAASIDDYQYMGSDVAKGVPNSDKDFGKNYPSGQVLASKRANADYYSEHMKEAAKATVRIDNNYDAIQAYVKGKTIAELEATLAATPKDKMVDVVSGATLQDTYGYVTAIVNAAKAAKENSSFEIETSALNSLKVGRVEAAAHGTKCFTVAVAFVVGDKIVACSTDDYQFMGSDVAKGVPNSDKDFGKNYPSGQVLASKRANADYYSEHMKEAANATKRIDDNYDAVQKYVDGKTIAELEATLAATPKEKMPVDVVSGATLADTYGYVTAILNAAKAAK